jgi:hypothetical protein
MLTETRPTNMTTMRPHELTVADRDEAEAVAAMAVASIQRAASLTANKCTMQSNPELTCMELGGGPSDEELERYADLIERVHGRALLGGGNAALGMGMNRGGDLDLFGDEPHPAMQRQLGMGGSGTGGMAGGGGMGAIMGGGDDLDLFGDEPHPAMQRQLGMGGGGDELDFFTDGSGMGMGAGSSGMGGMGGGDDDDELDFMGGGGFDHSLARLAAHNMSGMDEHLDEQESRWLEDQNIGELLAAMERSELSRRGWEPILSRGGGALVDAPVEVRASAVPVAPDRVSLRLIFR